MVAPAATTPAPRATGCSPTSAPSLASAPSSTHSPSASSAFSSSTLSLSHSVTESLLTALADPEASLASVARAHNISVASLTLWLSKPDTQARVREMESGASTHIRLAASLNLSSAVRVLVRILEDFNALARTHADPATRAADPDYIRASERARKAAYHLYRLSRITPLDESRLAHLNRSTRRAHAGESDTSPLPPSHSPCASSAALRAETSSSSSADSPSVALRDLSGESSSSGSSAFNTHSPSASSAALRVESSSPPASLEELTAHLESLAHSLGIDTSDLDEGAPLPPEILALFPPEIAAFLEHPPDIPDILNPPDLYTSPHSVTS